MLVTKTILFELPEPGPGATIAVKAIDRTGMKHMAVLDAPRAIIEHQTTVRIHRLAVRECG